MAKRFSLLELFKTGAVKKSPTYREKSTGNTFSLGLTYEVIYIPPHVQERLEKEAAS